MLPILAVIVLVLSFHAANAVRDDTEMRSATDLPSNAQLIQKLLEPDLQPESQFIQDLVGQLKVARNFVARKNIILQTDQGQLETWWASVERKARQVAEDELRKLRGEKPKCVAAFDFDQTLIRSHCTSEKVAVESAIRKRVWSDDPNLEPQTYTRLEKIHEMFGKLAAAGCKVVVITRNLKEYVEKALKQSSGVGGTPLGVLEVVGQKEFDNEEQNAEKGTWLRKNLLEPWGFEAPFNEVIFADDDSENTKEASTSLKDAMIVQPTDDLCTGDGNKPFIGPCEACKQTSRCPNGLSIADIDKIIEWSSKIA